MLLNSEENISKRSTLNTSPKIYGKTFNSNSETKD